MRYTRFSVINNLDKSTMLVIDENRYFRILVYRKVLKVERRPLLAHRIRDIEYIGKPGLQIFYNLDIDGLYRNVSKNIQGTDPERVIASRIGFRC